jgi:predicted transcriptional regulator
MERAHIKQLPVVNDGKLVGTVTDSDIMLAVPNMVSGMEPSVGSKLKSD